MALAPQISVGGGTKPGKKAMLEVVEIFFSLALFGE